MPTRTLRNGFALVLVGALACALAGCQGSGEAGGQEQTTTLTVYTDQHASFVEALTEAYTKKTGVEFDIQQNATSGQVVAEGKASPADVFLSEDPGPVAQLAKDGLLERLPAETIEHVREGLSSPKDLWVAYAARARVLYYNPTLIEADQLPRRLLDITRPQYKGRFAWAPSGAFVATTQYLLSTIGEDATRSFLTKLKENGVDEAKNGNVRDTVEAGKHAMGLSNHYYWWIKAAEVGGPEHMTSKIYHFPETDPGNLVLSSGAGILASSSHTKAAERFLSWLTDADGGQKVIAEGDIDQSAAQYPVAVGTSSRIVGSLDEIKSPRYDMGIYADQSQAERLLKSLGISS